MELRPDVAEAMRPLVGLGMAPEEFNAVCLDIQGLLDAGLHQHAAQHIRGTRNRLLGDRRAEMREAGDA